MRNKATLTVIILTALAANASAGDKGSNKNYLPSLEPYLLKEKREIALARSAAPARVSRDAAIMVLTDEGYRTAVEGSNGFVCLVLRSWGNPTFAASATYVPEILVPECLDRKATGAILPVQLFRAKLGVQGTPPARIKEEVQRGFREGRFRRTETVSFSYMMSAGMTFGSGASGPPHVMVYLPDDYSNQDVGGFPYSERVVFVEGGADEPFVAANIYVDEAIEPAY
jgi:hypothetical protein